MKTRLLFLSTIVAAIASVAIAQQPTPLTQYVNPYIGTGGHGHVFLGANVPFSLVQLGPNQHKRGWDWCSGYHYSDSILLGFSHMHLSGTGCGDLGDLCFLPINRTDQTETVFSHIDEQCRPGYYALRMHAPEVFVELTTTQRVGMHRYTFASSTQDPMLLFNMQVGNGWDELTDSRIHQDSPTQLSGFRRSKGWANDQMIYYVAQFSQPVTLDSVSNDIKAIIRPTRPSEPLVMKVALSPTSVEGAHRNMQAELPGWDFNQTVRKADEAWNRELARIQIKTNDPTVRRIFYTALYHTMTAPSVFCDVPQQSTTKTLYTTLSLWDTYRSLHPLFTLIFPEKQADFAETFMHIYRQQGKLPVWHLMGCETNCMVGSPAVPVLGDLVLKGFVQNEEEAFQTMKASQLISERSLGLLREHGYIPYDLEPSNETVAKALEYCLADDAVAKVAKRLGHTEDYQYFNQRAQSYRKYFDRQSLFMRAVDTKGQFRPEFDPIRVIHRADDYTEGNAWQYIWLVPHDPHGLISLFPSEKRFVEKLDSLFIVEGDLGEEASPDISGLIGQYAHGNEPSHHIIYMYDYAGQPAKAAPLLRRVMKEMYHDDFDGLSGNEDVGQMSAWYILSAMGLYQVEPSGGKFVIGSPVLDEATMNVGEGRTFTIRALNNSAENIYVQSARLNGKELKRSFLNFEEIHNGGTLELQMGPRPSRFGTKAKERP